MTGDRSRVRIRTLRIWDDKPSVYNVHVTFQKNTNNFAMRHFQKPKINLRLFISGHICPGPQVLDLPTPNFARSLNINKVPGSGRPERRLKASRVSERKAIILRSGMKHLQGCSKVRGHYFKHYLKVV